MSKEPVRQRAVLPALKFKEGSTMTDLLAQGPVAIRLLASASGHARVGIDLNVVQEEQASSMLRGQEALRSIQANIPKELSMGAKQRGKRYWHKKRESFVTIVECCVDGSKTRHRAIDDNDEEIVVEDRFLEDSV